MTPYPSEADFTAALPAIANVIAKQDTGVEDLHLLWIGAGYAVFKLEGIHNAQGNRPAATTSPQSKEELLRVMRIGAIASINYRSLLQHIITAITYLIGG